MLIAVLDHVTHTRFFSLLLCSDWGHDFRPDYNRLSMLRQTYPGVPLMALTATANEKVVNDAIRCLGMRNEFRYVSSFNRPNLRYQVLKKDSKTIDAIAAYINKRSNDSGVIYCLSRKDCETVAKKLTEKGVSASYYHAELPAADRERRHHDWSIGRINVLCATIAFGMGIDKPDVSRFDRDHLCLTLSFAGPICDSLLPAQVHHTLLPRKRSCWT